MLMDYFALNARDPQARKYFYSDILLHYTSKSEKADDGKKVSSWCKRKKFVNCFGRMYTVNPSQIELFNLRIL